MAKFALYWYLSQKYFIFPEMNTHEKCRRWCFVEGKHEIYIMLMMFRLWFWSYFMVKDILKGGAGEVEGFWLQQTQNQTIYMLSISSLAAVIRRGQSACIILWWCHHLQIASSATNKLDTGQTQNVQYVKGLVLISSCMLISLESNPCCSCEKFEF